MSVLGQPDSVAPLPICNGENSAAWRESVHGASEEGVGLSSKQEVLAGKTVIPGGDLSVHCRSSLSALVVEERSIPPWVYS
jgi:hypothetical protein